MHPARQQIGDILQFPGLAAELPLQSFTGACCITMMHYAQIKITRNSSGDEIPERDIGMRYSLQ